MGNIMILFVALLLVFAGCASTSIFPTNDSQALKSESEYGVLIAQPDVFQGRTLKLAGRMVGVETTAEGTLITAEWLPYPDAEYVGPTGTAAGSIGRFILFYPGKLDAEGIFYGNKFLVIGKKEENQSMTSFRSTSRSLPYMMARCLHVWKTGDSEIETRPDTEYSAYPVEETYCSDQ